MTARLGGATAHNTTAWPTSFENDVEALLMLRRFFRFCRSPAAKGPVPSRW